MFSLNTLLLSASLTLLCVDFKVEGRVRPASMKYSGLSTLLLFAWSTLKQGVHAGGEEVEQHLEMGKKMLAAGQLADALSHYHAAVEGDPNNYMTFYRRATVYLAMGKSKSALPDLDRVLELKSDFTSARIQRANVKMKQGRMKEAETDFRAVLEKEPGHEEARQKLAKIKPLQDNINMAQELFEEENYEETIGYLSPVIEACPWDPQLREMRAECYIKQGEYFKAINDIRPTVKLRNDNTAAHYKISQLQYIMGESDDSLVEIRECLKLDPDHKQCFPHYKKVKKLVKQQQSLSQLMSESKWDECIGKVDQMLKTEGSTFVYVHKANSHKCHCYSKGKHIKETFTFCNKVLETDSSNVEALCDRAEAHLVNENWDEAVRDYKRAEEVNGDLKMVQDGLKRAEKLLKQSKKRDYYKILGVKRNASKKEIVKSYRNLAQQWHPDKFQGEDKERAQKMFLDIAAAKEVLSDPEKREKFDNGEDPLDAEEQANQQGGNPFGHGFNPFGQGGFNFKFHFN